MKLVKTIPLSLVFCITTCESDAGKTEPAEQPDVIPKSPLDPPDHWKPLEQGLDVYVAANPGRPILLSISATWSATATLAWRVLFSDEITEMLVSAGWVCLVADVTEGDVAGNQAMRSLGRAGVPVTAIYDPVEKAWKVQSEVFTNDDVKNWVISLEVKTGNAKRATTTGP